MIIRKYIKLDFQKDNSTDHITIQAADETSKEIGKLRYEGK